MGVERRRAGFRLPWSADGEDTDATQAATTEAAGDAAPVAPEPTPTTAATEPVAETEAKDEEAMTADNTPASGAEGAPDGGSDDFLQSLVGAMRGVAETSRDASVAELRTAMDARIEALRTESADRETDIRRQADTDLEAVGDWERAEIERVKGEAEGKRTDRRTQLEQQLAAHRTASEQAMAAARSRLAQHENELAAFFAQLGEITDPAAFVAAAKRMPRAPELEGTPVVESVASPASSAADARLEALGVTPETVSADPQVAEATPGVEGSATTADAPASDVTSSGVGEAAAPETANEESPANGTPSADAQLAERLAQLDERLAAAQPATPAIVPATGGETSTAIVVKGLGSFGAITSFKQSLERVEGVRGVTLSLGPTGEFVYRASHASDFDLVGAIQGLEGPTASIENTDGSLVVTLSRAR